MRTPRVLTAMVLAAVTTAGLMAVPTAALAVPSTWRCNYELMIRSHANGSFVRAETSYSGGMYGMLRAAGGTGLPTSDFARCDWFDEEEDMWVFAIWSYANRLWVSAEPGYSGDDNGMLRARATDIGKWEKFVQFDSSKGYAWYSLANNRFVSTELAYSGTREDMLRARATVIGPWEQFEFVPIEGITQPGAHSLSY